MKIQLIMVVACGAMLVACAQDKVETPAPEPVAPTSDAPPAPETVEDTAPPELEPVIEAAPEPEPDPVPEPEPEPVVSACGLEDRFVHQTKHDGDRPVFTGSGAIAFQANYAVNTDGAPTSYHPDDPWGSKGLAINTVCNGVDVTLADGTKYDYSKCRELVPAFETARDGGWTADSGPRVRFYGAATVGSSGDAANTPCINDAAPYEGYLVSTTSLIADPSKGRCDQSRYLDSLELPFIIYPGNQEFTSRGMGLRDLVFIFDPKTGRETFAIVGDRGPGWGLGEGSVKIGKVMNGTGDNPASRRDTYRFGSKEIVTIVFTDTTLQPPYTAEAVAAAGEAALADFGGRDRASACATELAEAQGN